MSTDLDRLLARLSHAETFIVGVIVGLLLAVLLEAR